MPKVAKNARTPVQERILSAVALLTLTAGEGSYFCETAINRVLGGRLTEHRKNALRALKSSGWLESQDNVWNKHKYYRLTETGFAQLSTEYDIKSWEIMEDRKKREQKFAF